MTMGQEDLYLTERQRVCAHALSQGVLKAVQWGLEQ